MGMTFYEARDKAGKDCTLMPTTLKQPVIKPIRFPTQSWVEKAEKFVENSYQRLLIDPVILNHIQSTRGLTIETIERARIGWNPTWSKQRRSDWSVVEEKAKLWMPLAAGIVIPTFLEGKVSRIAIRRNDWKAGDSFGKYCQLPGNSNMISVFGFRMNQVAILVESELDAILLTQEIGEFCTCIALSGCANDLDLINDEWLHERRLILYSLDVDEAGCKKFDRWRSTYSRLRPWQANSRKSPADSHLLDGVNLKDWFEAGIRYWEGKI
jgi:hypothetical protein